MTERPQASFRQQLWASVVRNLRLKIRDSRKTTAEIFLPLYTLGTLIVLKILIPNPNFPAILEPHGTGKVFEHFNVLKNHTVAVVQTGNGSRQHTEQVRKSSGCENFFFLFFSVSVSGVVFCTLYFFFLLWRQKFWLGFRGWIGTEWEWIGGSGNIWESLRNYWKKF